MARFRLALIAHDQKKDAMVEWAARHRVQLVVVGQQLVGQLSQSRLLAERDERLARCSRQSHPDTAGQPVTERNGEAQLIDIESAPDDAARLGTRGGDREVGLAVEHPPGDLVRWALVQIEADPGG